MNPYALLGGAAVALGLLAAVFFYRGEAAQAEALAKQEATRAETAIGANASLVASLAERDRLDAIRAESFAALTSQVDALYRQNENTRLEISQLARDNDAIRDYLATELPADLAGVLNRPAGRGGAGQQSTSGGPR